MLEHATYSVISPEGCASILWRSTNYSQEAANTLKLTSEDCKIFDIIDEIIPEKAGGAHRYPEDQSKTVKDYILKHLLNLNKIPIEKLVKLRKEKYCSFEIADSVLGQWLTLLLNQVTCRLCFW